MYGTVRGVATLVGAGIAGGLVWLSTQIGQGSTGGYWAAVGILAGAGLTMAVSQLAGGWTKWGVPRISAGVFLIGFLPVLVVAGWVLLAGQPDANWFQRHVDSWSGSIAIDGPVHDLRAVLAVLAFGLGLVFGLTFDTSGPRRPGGADLGELCAGGACGARRAGRGRRRGADDRNRGRRGGDGAHREAHRYSGQRDRTPRPHVAGLSAACRGGARLRRTAGRTGRSRKRPGRRR